ncbi:CHAT domain-containing protein [Anabaena sp. FACHB-1237]|nr:CHAT domain-containing protein [Anabaena sp. FACHB-1237]
MIMIFRKFRQTSQLKPKLSSRLKYISLAILVTLLTILQVNKGLLIGMQPVIAAVKTEVRDQNSVDNSVVALVQAGKENYQAEKFNEAIAQWQKALEIYKQDNDTINQGVILSNMALAYQKLGQWQQANESISQSWKLIQNQKAEKILAQILNIQGSLQLGQGKTQAALTSWEKATEMYQKLGDEAGINRSLLNQSQALRVLGLYPRAKKTLEQISKNLEKQPDSIFKVETLINLGDTLRLMGLLDKSTEILKQGQTLAEKIKSPEHTSLALLSLGNTALSFQKIDQASEYYQQVINKNPAPNIKLQAQLNLLKLFSDSKQPEKINELLAEIKPQIEQLPASRTNIYAKVGLAEIIQKNNQNPQIAASILATAIQQAKSIGDVRSESYALGYLGGVYEQTKQWQESQKLTEQALMLAQSNNFADISYLWQWQLGRIYQATDNQDGAIEAYNQAVKTLGYIKKDLVAGNTNQEVTTQFSFQESVEPIYRELVGLLLEPRKRKNNKEKSKNNDVDQVNLQKALDLIESLKVAELDNYFGEDCLASKVAKIDQVDSTAAIVYPIILRDRLETIVSITNQPLRKYTTPINQVELEKTLQQMRLSLKPNIGRKQQLNIAEKTYKLLIEQIDQDLSKSKIKTLVFVLDGSMKSIPMAALYDGKKYLIQKYNLAQTPGLQLLSPKPIQQKELKILIGGITESRQGFAPLPGVKLEVQDITSKIPSQVLFNETFTNKDFERLMQVTPFPIVHLATHGEFSSSADNTFILTWDNRLKVKELGELLQIRDQDSNTPIELLVLSACQTAKGDKRAPLGLAGVAIRSGARSTIASLWSVDDNSTSQFMQEFYKQLSSGKITKAEAVRQAQTKILENPEFQNAYYWAAFVLVGNWL